MPWEGERVANVSERQWYCSPIFLFETKIKSFTALGVSKYIITGLIADLLETMAGLFGCAGCLSWTVFFLLLWF